MRLENTEIILIITTSKRKKIKVCEGEYPCRSMTHSTDREIRNLIVRGEDLLLGDHGQPNQTLGSGDKRDARWIT